MTKPKIDHSKLCTGLIKHDWNVICQDCPRLENKKPLFTKKHYKAIAEVIKKIINEEDSFTEKKWEKFLDFDDFLMMYFKKDNPKFDSSKFWKEVWRIYKS